MGTIGGAGAWQTFLISMTQKGVCNEGRLCQDEVMSFDSSASLDALCDQLARATSARKVLVCAEDGSILAHAGERGVFTNQISADLANLVAQVLVEAQQAGEGIAIPVEDRYTRVGRLHVCAAPLANRALLLVLFDDGT